MLDDCELWMDHWETGCLSMRRVIMKSGMSCRRIKAGMLIRIDFARGETR